MKLSRTNKKKHFKTNKKILGNDRNKKSQKVKSSLKLKTQKTMKGGQIEKIIIDKVSYEINLDEFQSKGSANKQAEKAIIKFIIYLLLKYYINENNPKKIFFKQKIQNIIIYFRDIFNQTEDDEVKYSFYNLFNLIIKRFKKDRKNETLIGKINEIISNNDSFNNLNSLKKYDINFFDFITNNNLVVKNTNQSVSLYNLIKSKISNLNPTEIESTYGDVRNIVAQPQGSQPTLVANNQTQKKLNVGIYETPPHPH